MRNDALVETLETPFPFGYNHQLERPVAVPKHRQVQLSLIGQNCLAGMPFSAVAGASLDRVSLLLAQMLTQLRTQRVL